VPRLDRRVWSFLLVSEWWSRGPPGGSRKFFGLRAGFFPRISLLTEYRIVNRDLVLWDIQAGQVVDYLPDAFRAVAMTLRRVPQ
jgi:hypothetical protein